MRKSTALSVSVLCFCSYSNSQTLQTVTDQGNSTNRNISVAQISTNGGQENAWFSPNGTTYLYSNALDGYGRIGVFGSSGFLPLCINEGGSYVGVGITDPTTLLDVAGVFQTRNKDTRYAHWDNLQIWSDGYGSHIESNGDEHGLTIRSNAGNKILLLSKVGIGTESTNEAGFNLFVEAGVRTRKVKVDQLTWPDYVFDSAYQLAPLRQVEAFIQENKHLPDVPSAGEVKKAGLDVGDTQAVLLKKIEELTLYIIEQHKKLEMQDERLKALEAKSKS